MLSVSSSSDLGMVSSDGVLFTFTGLMEMHSIGDLEMLTGNSIQNTSVSSHHMSDGVFFTGLMEMHSIGDLEMLTGNSIHNTSVSSHHMSDAETWKCSQELAPYV